MSEPESASTAPARTEGAPSMFHAELIVALALFGFGLLVAWDSYRTGSGWSAMSGPRAGYFPFRLGLLLALCGAAIAVQTLRRRGSLRVRFIEPGQIRPVLTVAIPSLIYVAGVQWLGIYVASFVFVAAFMRWAGGLAWWRCGVVGLSLVVLTFWLFEKRFFLPLPKGPLEAWLGIY
jgi:putative tricarboxylic transport membrane protein